MKQIISKTVVVSAEVDDDCQKTKRRAANMNPSSNRWEKIAIKRCF